MDGRWSAGKAYFISGQVSWVPHMSLDAGHQPPRRPEERLERQAPSRQVMVVASLGSRCALRLTPPHSHAAFPLAQEPAHQREPLRQQEECG